MHGDGEIHAARAAEAFGIPFCLSTVSICSIEDVREATRTPFWFQLYVMKDRGYTAELIDRAEAAGCPVLMMTVDIPVSGLRRRDAKNGLAVPPRLTLRNALDIATKPRWAWSVLRGKRREFGNLAAAVARHRRHDRSRSGSPSQFDASVTWKDLEQIRARWKGKLIVKGIMDPEDARRVVALGADALVVSNHGGRQLDGAASTHLRAAARGRRRAAGAAKCCSTAASARARTSSRRMALGANATLTGPRLPLRTRRAGRGGRHARRCRS